MRLDYVQPVGTWAATLLTPKQYDEIIGFENDTGVLVDRQIDGVDCIWWILMLPVWSRLPLVRTRRGFQVDPLPCAITFFALGAFEGRNSTDRG